MYNRHQQVENALRRKIQWAIKSNELMEKLKKYDEEYKKKICSSCSLEEKRRYDCQNYFNPKKESYCTKMVYSRNKKFAREVSEELKESIQVNDPMAQFA